jgi:hypothetical protein
LRAAASWQLSACDVHAFVGQGAPFIAALAHGCCVHLQTKFVCGWWCPALHFAVCNFAVCQIVALTQGWGVQWLYSHEAGGASAFFDQNEFAQWRVSNLGPAADCCSGNDRLCRRALAEAQRGQTNKQFPSTDPDNS